MRYITKDEFYVLEQVIEAIEDGMFTDEYKALVERMIGDTVDVITVNNILTLKYSNVLLIGIETVQ